MRAKSVPPKLCSRACGGRTVDGCTTVASGSRGGGKWQRVVAKIRSQNIDCGATACEPSREEEINLMIDA